MPPTQPPIHTTPRDTQIVTPEQQEPGDRHQSWVRRLFASLIAGAVAAVSFLYYLSTPPGDFQPRTLTVLPGSTVSAIAADTHRANLVRSELILYGALVGLYRNEPIKAGTYTFSAPASVFEIAYQLTHTTPADELVRITLPEGMTAAAYEEIIARELPNFDRATYRRLTTEREGYLHPETYYVPIHYATEALVALLEDGTRGVLSEYESTIAASGLTETEVLTLASILEREANSPESMKMVSGILQNRLDLGMPLQADATIEYVLDTPLNELPEGELANQLRAVDSPYNTYQNQGLPPTPIGNPGRVAIEAVLFPTLSDYLFYITGTDGNFYYATTYEAHQANIDQYLR